VGIENELTKILKPDQWADRTAEQIVGYIVEGIPMRDGMPRSF
jgi:hypothetical protein